jgi:hypothetical protein
MSLSLAEKELVVTTSTLSDKKQITMAVETISTNMKKYALNTASCLKEMKTLFLSLLKNGNSSAFFHLYSRFRIMSTAAEALFNADVNIPFEVVAADACITLTMYPDKHAEVIQMLDVVLSNNQGMSIHQLLHAVVQSSVEVDCSIEEEEMQNRLPPTSNRHKIFGYIQANYSQKFNSYLKLVLVSLWTDIIATEAAPKGSVILPQILKEYYISISFSKVPNNALASSLCEIIALNENARKENVLAKILSFFDQLAPPNVSVDIISKHLICSHTKSSVRRIASLNMIGRLEELCNEYEFLDNLHCTMVDDAIYAQKPFCRVFCSDSAWGFTSSTTARVTTLEVHKRLLSDSFTMICATALDSMMLDPAEANRWGAMVNFVTAFEKIKPRAIVMVGKKNLIPIQEQFLQVMIMKVNDKSARIRTRAAALLLSEEAFIKAPLSYATLGRSPDSLFEGIRHLLRVRIRSTETRRFIEYQY